MVRAIRAIGSAMTALASSRFSSSASPPPETWANVASWRREIVSRRTRNNFRKIEEQGWRREWESSSEPFLESVSYRFHNATVAVDAGDAVAHCPLLPATSRPPPGS